jgi:hypothetical protein
MHGTDFNGIGKSPKNLNIFYINSKKYKKKANGINLVKTPQQTNSFSGWFEKKSKSGN